jgi:biopolymer transport protein TolR
MGMGSSGGGSRAPLSEINVTPLVDVMLVLLIIFMVAAPMMTTAVPIDLPRARAERIEVENETPLLTVANDGRIFLGRDEVPFTDLAARVAAHPAIRRDGKLYVQADETVPYGRVVQIFSVVREAGVSNLGLVTDPAGGGAVLAPTLQAPPTQGSGGSGTQ